MTFIIRPIEKKDNSAVKNIVITVLGEFGYTGPGYASSDAELDKMYESYLMDGAGYFVVEHEASGELFGGGGFTVLNGANPREKICELRKLYLLPTARGFRLGEKLVETILSKALVAGYTEIYLETTPELVAAIKLYEKMGFVRLKCNKGNTGHQEKCTVYMGKELQTINA